MATATDDPVIPDVFHAPKTPLPVRPETHAQHRARVCKIRATRPPGVVPLAGKVRGRSGIEAQNRSVPRQKAVDSRRNAGIQATKLTTKRCSDSIKTRKDQAS